MAKEQKTLTTFDEVKQEIESERLRALVNNAVSAIRRFSDNVNSRRAALKKAEDRQAEMQAILDEAKTPDELASAINVVNSRAVDLADSYQ